MRKNGFTLVELLASITLIIILFSIAVPVSINLVQNSNRKQCEGILNTIISSAELYVLDNPNFYNDTFLSKTITFADLYKYNYIDEEYDFQNGFVLKKGVLYENGSESQINGVTVERRIDGENIATNEGYFEYVLDKICN